MIRAIVFDFDGVILDSVGIKTRAFMRLFERWGEEAAARVLAYHDAHGGVSRFRKFDFIHEHILKTPLSEVEKARLGEEFRGLAYDQVLGAEWIPGALEFLQEHSERLACFVASGTPQEELRAIIETRGATRYFAEAHGSPATKAEIVRDVLQRHGFEPGEAAFVGDTTTDYDAAMETGLRFVGVGTVEKHPFPSGTEVLRDLRGLAGALALTR